MRRLIINADDLGYTTGINRGVREGHDYGLITSTTIMANSPAFFGAVKVALDRPSLGVGCHVVLMEGAPLLPAAEVPTLAPGGRFRDSLLQFAREAVRGRIAPEEIEAEATAQIRKLQAAGVDVTHFDTHKHAHMFPSVLAPLLRAAKACGVRALRNPFAPIKPLAFAHLLRRPRLWTRYTEVRILRRYLQRFRDLVTGEGMVTTDGSFGIVVTGRFEQRLFDAIIGCLPEGTWELVTHPGHCDHDLRACHTRLKESREKELAMLTSAASREAVTRKGVELISYGDLKATAERAENAETSR